MPKMPDSLEGLSQVDAEALRAEFASAFTDLYAGGNASLTAEQESTLVGFATNVQALDAHIRKASLASMAQAVETAPVVTYATEDNALTASGDEAVESTGSFAASGSSTTTPTGSSAASGDSNKKQMAADVEPAAEAAADTSASTALAEGTTADTELAAGGSDNTTQEDDVANDQGTEALVASGTAESAADLMNANRAAVAAHGVTSSVRKPSVFAGTESGLKAGETTIRDVASAIEGKVRSSNEQSFRSAFAQGRQIRQQFSMATFESGVSDEFAINDAASIDASEAVFALVTDEKRLSGGSLVASGGWGAPSETDYSMLAQETTDGLLSLPTVKIVRGGLRTTKGPKFNDILANAIFHYTEAQDISGSDYPKPQYKPVAPDFTDTRLVFDGAFVPAGLLMSKGYPELIERVIKGVLVAHPHKIDGQVITNMVNDSTPVSVAAGSIDGISNLLTAIELQVGHMRQYNRLRMDQSLEIVLPAFAKEMIRAQMAERQYVDLISVNDARINQFFTNLGVNAQFVYNWQDIAGTAATGYGAFPTTLQFLLYPAGTWVKGTSDIITLNTVFDSNLLETNDYTALFTEEGWLTIKRAWDSRVVTVQTSA